MRLGTMRRLTRKNARDDDEEGIGGAIGEKNDGIGDAS